MQGGCRQEDREVKNLSFLPTLHAYLSLHFAMRHISNATMPEVYTRVGKALNDTAAVCVVRVLRSAARAPGRHERMSAVVQNEKAEDGRCNPVPRNTGCLLRNMNRGWRGKTYWGVERSTPRPRLRAAFLFQARCAKTFQAFQATAAPLLGAGQTRSRDAMNQLYPLRSQTLPNNMYTIAGQMLSMKNTPVEEISDT